MRDMTITIDEYGTKEWWLNGKVFLSEEAYWEAVEKLSLTEF